MERSSRRVRAVFCARGTSFNTAVDVDIVTGPMHFPFQAPQKTNKADLPEIRGKIMHLVKVLTPAPGITIHKLPPGHWTFLYAEITSVAGSVPVCGSASGCNHASRRFRSHSPGL